MDYYLMLPGDTEADSVGDANLLGTASFDLFWSGSGLRVLMDIVNNNPYILPQCTIITQKGDKLSVTQFLDQISKLKLRIQ